MTLSILVFIFITYFNVNPVESDCRVTIKNDLTGISPMYFDAQLNFRYPTLDERGVLTLGWYEDLLVYCPVGTAKLRGVEYPRRSDVPYYLPPVVRCIRDDLFELAAAGRPRIKLEELQCTQKHSPVAWPHGIPCGQGITYDLGYVFDNRHRGIIRVCYDEQAGTTHWASARIPASIGGKQTLDPRPDFKSANFYLNIPIKRYYSGCEQIDTFVRIFRHVAENGDEDFMDDAEEAEAEKQKENVVRKHVGKYIKLTDNTQTPPVKRNILVKGHLIAQADMFYAAEQAATYIYANAVPMWESINNGNWKAVENAVRSLAARKGELSVIVGTIGVLQLEKQYIYLGRKKGQIKPVMPVPKILFKAAYNRTINEGIVYLTINNPYVTEDELPDYTGVCEHYPPCRTPTNNDKYYYGFVWCCLFETFFNSPQVIPLGIPNVPSGVGPML